MGDAYKGALVLGAPSIIGAWGFDVLRDAAAAMKPPLETKILKAADEIGPEEAWRGTVYLTQFPSASVLSIVESGRMPVVAFLDEACDAIAFIRRSSGCSFVEALRSATSGAVVNRALFTGRTALVISRGHGGSVASLVDRILAHLSMRLPDAAANSVKQKYCGSELAAGTLEERLQGMSAYKPPGEWSDMLTASEASIAKQVLSPLLQMALQEQCVPIKWPNDVFLSGDRPNERAPLVADVAGGARYLFYGPYFHLPPGTYRARLVAGFSQAAVGAPFTAEVYAASTLLAKARFQPHVQGILQGEFLVIHKTPQDRIEVRFRSDESLLDGRVGLAWVEFRYLGDGDAQAYKVT